MTYSNTKENIIEQIADIALSRSGLSVKEKLDWQNFEDYSSYIDRHFVTPQTTFTPEMCGFVWALSEKFKPAVCVGIGTYVGFTFSWLVHSELKDDTACDFYAVDVDPDACKLAEHNLSKLSHQNINVICQDGVRFLDGFKGTIDLLYIDIDAPKTGKGGYTDILKAALNSLSPGCLILAHDVLVPKFASSFEQYRDYIENTESLQGPWDIKIDECGLSVSFMSTRLAG